MKIREFKKTIKEMQTDGKMDLEKVANHPKKQHVLYYCLSKRLPILKEMVKPEDKQMVISSGYMYGYKDFHGYTWICNADFPVRFHSEIGRRLNIFNLDW